MESIITKVLVLEGSDHVQGLLRKHFPADMLQVDSERCHEELLKRCGPGRYDLLILNLATAESGALKAADLLGPLPGDGDSPRIIAITDRPDVRRKLERMGVSRTITWPVDEDEICALVNPMVGNGEPYRKILRDPIPLEFEGMLGISLPMREVFQRILVAAATDVAVLITGETGTGKELVAAAIHKKSRRKDFPYVPVNTGAMPVDLIASELFGHERGAFTGAAAANKGHFESADGGTIFLDEVSTMDEKAQVSLLRILETKTFRRVGGDKDIRVDVRVIAATNEDLEAAVAEKRFREDLFFRLDVFSIHVPLLRERPGGVTMLTSHFVPFFNRLYAKQVKTIAPEAFRLLRRYSWPGNVRELKNVIQRAVLMAKGQELTADLLPPRLRTSDEGEESATEGSPFRVGMKLASVEREFIQMTLDSTGGNKKEAALILGISRRALYNKLKKYGLF